MINRAAGSTLCAARTLWDLDNRAYLAPYILHSALIPLWGTLNMLVTLATIGETNDESI
jgi:hypothetical protein